MAPKAEFTDVNEHLGDKSNEASGHYRQTLSN
jgi:hypothetical protein